MLCVFERRSDVRPGAKFEAGVRGIFNEDGIIGITGVVAGVAVLGAMFASRR